MPPVNETNYLNQSLASGALWASVTAGLVAGLRTVLGGAAIAALILPAGSPEFGKLLNNILLSGALVGLLITWLSAYKGVIAQPQDGPAVLIGAFAATIASQIPGITPDRTAAVVFGAVMLSSLLTGIVFYVLGQWRIARFVRFIPYPVIGGFLAGSGLLIILIALNVLVGERLIGADWSTLHSNGRLVTLTAGVVYGASLYAVLRRYRHFLTLPIALIGTALLFHAMAYATGISVNELREQGWLVQVTENKAGAFSPGWLSMAVSEWAFLSQNVLTFAAVALVSAVALLLNLSGLEVAARTELDFNRELKLTGLANIAGGLLGGIVSFHALSASLLGRQMGVNSRSIGVTASLLAIGIVLVGHNLLTYIPIPLLGALLICTGYALLHDWLIAGRARFSAMEYITVIVITMLMAAVGYLAGVGAGILLSTAFFVWRYSHLKVISQEVSGNELHSNVERSSEDMRLLEEHGHLIRVLKIEGFLFFGTAFTMLDRIQHLVQDGGVRYVILDMAQVKAADSSALSVFLRISMVCERHDARLYLTRADAGLHSSLLSHANREGITFSFYEDRDFALEHCENLLLVQYGGNRAVSQTWDRVASQLANAEDLQIFKSYFVLRDVPAGDFVMRQGEESSEMFFVESGRIQILLNTEDNREIRLRSMTAGTLIGEVGLYLGGLRTASARAETPTRLYTLTKEKLREMEHKHGHLAQAMNSSVIRLLSERLSATNRLVQRLYS